MIIWDADDFGADHIISDMCQSHDCRDVLLKFKEINPNFKATLFAIPGQMTQELLDWSQNNQDWVELAVHGFYHDSNYECEKITYVEFEDQMEFFYDMIEDYFVKGFKAPGWQISNEAYEWLLDNGWWVADQEYNDGRRPKELRAYVNNNGQFSVNGMQYNGQHYHTWNCMGNGVYERYNDIIKQLGEDTRFKFVSEVVSEAYSDEKQ